MNTLIDQVDQQWTLTAMDRCDAACSAQAYIKVVGVSGELLFCVHHYEKIMSNSKGYDNLTAFSYSVIDERERLIENRLVGEN